MLEELYNDVMMRISKLKAHSAASKIHGCAVRSNGGFEQRLERLLIPLDLSGMVEPEHRL